MKAQRINITLPFDLIKDMELSIPSGKRSEFIATAVSEKLKKKRNLKQELIKSLKANYEFDKALAKEWEAIDFETWPEWK